MVQQKYKYYCAVIVIEKINNEKTQSEQNI